MALAPLLQAFVDRWTRDHQDLAARALGHGSAGAGRNAKGHLIGNDSISAVTILHERTVLADPRRRGVSTTTIRRVLGMRSRYTELRTADALLIASGQDDAFHDGTVPVRPNPHAAPADRAACCGGSLNGSLSF